MSLSDLIKSDQHFPGKPIREKARVYIRVSHERSAEKAISPETQRRRLEACARDHDYEIICWYVDEAKSAFRDDDLRTEWQRMLADAKADPYTTVILVYRYDRFSRGENAQAIQADLLRHGVRIESAEEGYYDPDSEVGAIMMPLTWSLNRLFSIKLRNLVIPNMKTNFEQRDPETGWAYKNGGRAQFGYTTKRIHLGKGRKSRDIYKQVWIRDETIVANKPVWEWTRIMLLEWRLKERLGYASIASKLTNAGIPTPTGRLAWSMSTVQSLFSRERLYQYAGIGLWNREDCTDRHMRRQRDTSEWVIVPNAHEAIITELECDQIYEMVKDRKRTRVNERGKASSYALSGGLLKCKHCGSNYSATVKNGRPYYACGSHIYRRGAGCGPAWYIPREKAENIVFAKILAGIPEDGLQRWADELNGAIETKWKLYEQTSKDRKKSIKQLEARLSNYLDMVGRRGADEQLRTRIDKTTADIERLRRLDAVPRPPTISPELLKHFRDEIVDAAASTDSSRRAKILKALIIEITADAESKTLRGSAYDPRGFVAESMAAPRGVEPLSRP